MIRFAVIAAFGLSACTPMAPDRPTPPAPPRSGALCDANTVQDVVGKPVTQVRSDALTRSGARTIRTYKPGDPITMDLRPDRLDLVTDADGRVIEAKCG